MKKVVDVVAAIIVRDGKVLATERGYGEFKGGWEFPGGKIEQGECPEAALIREIKEELDADISIDSHLVDVEYDYETFHLSMRCYICHLANDHLQLLEHEAAKWLASDELETVDWLPADISVVEALNTKIQ